VVLSCFVLDRSAPSRCHDQTLQLKWVPVLINSTGDGQPAADIIYEEQAMIEIEIPGYRKLQLKYLVLDYNGTLAVDGRLVDGVGETLQQLSDRLEIHVLTADTFGEARAGLAGLTCRLSILPPGHQDTGKRDYIERLGAEFCACVGNGRNDRLMLKEASLGIAVIQREGAAAATLADADAVCPDILAALELLTNPLRLVATLRS